MKLNSYDHSWKLTNACPCDMHFVDFIHQNDIRARRIYHFGSGDHHLLGKENQNQNKILSITASKSEYNSYIDLIMDNPKLGLKYKVYFGDIYTENFELLPELDIVTLFHLGEYYQENSKQYGAIDDLKLLHEMGKKLTKHGLLLFYRGSNAFQRMIPTIDEWKKTSNFDYLGNYKTLEIFQKTP